MTAKIRTKPRDKVGIPIDGQESTPITMRLEERVINRLKNKARRLSFDRNCDISYVDLIREAVGTTYGITTDPIFNQLADFGIDKVETRTFWTAERISQFNDTPTAKMIIKCIDSNDFEPYVKLYNENLKEWLYSRSIAFAIMEKTAGSNGMCIIAKDVASVALVVKSRGAVPDIIMEGSSVIVPDFDICCYQTISTKVINPHLMFDIMVKSIISIQREMDSNVFNAMSAAAIEKQNQIVVEVGNHISQSSISEAFSNLAQHSLVPNAAIMHVKNYIDISMFGKAYLSAPPLKEALETKNYGTIDGVPVIVNNRCDINKIFVTPQPMELGVIYIPEEPNVRYNPENINRKKGFVITLRCGIYIVNDWAVSMVKLNGLTS